MMSYICEGIIVKCREGREGMVIKIDRKNKVALIRGHKNTFTEDMKNLTVLSYRGVE